MGRSRGATVVGRPVVIGVVVAAVTVAVVVRRAGGGVGATRRVPAVALIVHARRTSRRVSLLGRHDVGAATTSRWENKHNCVGLRVEQAESGRGRKKKKKVCAPELQLMKVPPSFFPGRSRDMI